MLQVSVATTVKLLGNIVRFFMMFDDAEHQPSYDFHTKHRNCQSLEVQCMRQHGPRVQAHLLASVCHTEVQGVVHLEIDLQGVVHLEIDKRAEKEQRSNVALCRVATTVPRWPLGTTTAQAHSTV
jgi:hypothetical protein